MPSRSFLIKPASSLCNMRCRYCFYEDEVNHRTQHSTGIMTGETSLLLIREALAAGDIREGISFAFQGGEPTLAGLDYFEAFTAMVKRLNTRGIPVWYSIQTNGLSLDENWAVFFRENRFLVGVSLDGDKTLHDACRTDALGKGTWNRVNRSIALLRKHGVEVNLLCVVTERCAKNPVRVYHALQKTGVRYLQFIPCLDPLDTPRGGMPYSLKPDSYGSFLCGLFDEWYRDWAAGRYTSIRLFDDYVHLAMGLPSSTCVTSGSCGSYFVVEADGSLYPCDFYALDGWKIGKLGEAPLRELENSAVARRFLSESQHHPAHCSACKWYPLCFGGCKRDWTSDPDTGEKRHYYCDAFQRFFSYAAPRIFEIARAEYSSRLKQRG